MASEQAVEADRERLIERARNMLDARGIGPDTLHGAWVGHEDVVEVVADALATPPSPAPEQALALPMVFYDGSTRERRLSGLAELIERHPGDYRFSIVGAAQLAADLRAIVATEQPAASDTSRGEGVDRPTDYRLGLERAAHECEWMARGYAAYLMQPLLDAGKRIRELPDNPADEPHCSRRDGLAPALTPPPAEPSAQGEVEAARIRLQAAVDDVAHQDGSTWWNADTDHAISLADVTSLLTATTPYRERAEKAEARERGLRVALEHATDNLQKGAHHYSAPDLHSAWLNARTALAQHQGAE